MPTLLIFAIFLALFFSFWNGFTDAANAISTIVATRVLTPIKAVLVAALGNFTGLIFGTAVAETIGRGIVTGEIINAKFIIAVLIGGMVWDVATWFFGLPISESHVLVGGLIGAGIVAAGASSVKLEAIIDKVVIPMVTSPLVAFFIAVLLTSLLVKIFIHFSQEKINRYFRKLQIVSSFFLSVTHGTNDAQKVMGIITILLVQYGLLADFKVPVWVMLASYGAISLGTLFGGWRIVKTMASRITQLRPYQGFCAETGGALVLIGTALLGFPVSTTHAISGAIMGVGAVRRFSAVRWVMARKIVYAWILTIPASAVFSAITYFLIDKII
ncbi:inorganic phosphate transporter [Candidatus Gottesmanbacteria bacterium]|nr:inorganic phosphate transporter [Candidatus Gottesmanbacteria bacterium]